MKGRIFKSVVVAVLAFASHLAHAGTVTYVYTDPQGTPLAEANASGAITATFDYRPYGSQALGSPKAGPGYTGHVNDPDTGFVYMQARYYDPGVGRFLSVDPKAPEPGGLHGFNRFDYVNNDPVGRIDPDGRESWLVSRPTGYYKMDHMFVVVADKAGGKVKARFSYGPNKSPIHTLLGQSKLVSLTGTRAETNASDAAAWKSLSGDSKASSNGVSIIKINANDSDVIESGNRINRVLGTLGSPGEQTYSPAVIGTNSNSAAYAVADLANMAGGAKSGSQKSPSGIHPLAGNYGAIENKLYSGTSGRW